MNSHAEAALSTPLQQASSRVEISVNREHLGGLTLSPPPSVDSGSRPDLPKRARFARSYRRVALSHTRGYERKRRGVVRACFGRKSLLRVEAVRVTSGPPWADDSRLVASRLP
jgi:hypothetical protein